MTDISTVERTIKALRRNGFEPFVVRDAAMAATLFFEQIVPTIPFKTFAWGDSITMNATGVIDTLRSRYPERAIVTFDPAYDFDTKIEMRRRALTADLFLTGSNALTERGQIVNTDMIGNRTSAISFGPRWVVLFVGVNKIVATIDDAFERIRTIAAPLNAKRHTNITTPCQRTGRCVDCYSPDRICNVRTIQERSFPAGRIKVILIEESLGL